LDISASRGDIVSWLRLSLLPGVSAGAQRKLLAAFETPQGVLAASPESISECTRDVRIAALIAAGPDRRLLDATLEWIERDGHHLITLGDAAYPPGLLQIHDPPTVLYARGDIERLAAPAIAIVGSRNATPQGMRDAHAFAAALSAAGLCIVSGLALGIDSAAHRGGLAGPGSSVAVLGTGADRIYPRRNRELGDEIAARGCLLSEFALGAEPLPGNFPRRNRLISGLARGVLIVEAAMRSGSLTTARFALDQGREVFAVPGSIHAPHSKGCHWLIKEGAKLVEEADDVLTELGFDVPDTRAGVAAARRERDPVLAAIGYAAASIDEIAERTGLDAAKLAALLSRLEIEGRVQALAGGRFQRVESRVIE
jgi:DNA processing protein